MSYASGYPEEGDLYLSLALEVDPATGELKQNAVTGQVVPYDGNPGLLVRWSEIEYLVRMEFQV